MTTMREALEAAKKVCDKHIEVLKCACEHPCEDYLVYPGPCLYLQAKGYRDVKAKIDAALSAEWRPDPKTVEQVAEALAYHDGLNYRGLGEKPHTTNGMPYWRSLAEAAIRSLSDHPSALEK